MLVRKRGIWREALLTGYTVLLGFLLHFVYGWSGSNVFAAGFSAVNESTWEHMKLLFFPVFLLTLLQTCTRRAADTCIPAVRAISVFIGLSLIPMLYYTYTGIVGTHALWADIAVFILAAAGTFATDSLLTRSGVCAVPGSKSPECWPFGHWRFVLYGAPSVRPSWHCGWTL